ncbi:MAG: glycoside hydrolase family 2 TIM barrel-domain containing protein [Holophagae bacterium]
MRVRAVVSFRRTLCFGLGILVLVASCAADPPELRATRVVSDGGTYSLIRDGQPYFIRGAGGHSHLDVLVAAGGNSIRTWGADGLDEILDAAHRHGLTVCVGLWLGHERHGFDYQDRTAVREQLEVSVGVVRRYKDHPAVLMWGIGNEMEGDGTNPAIWRAVEDIAREVKRIDPVHPTMTVIAELGNDKVQRIDRWCPSIDIIGVNSYGGLTTLGERYRSAGGSKPYIVTEFGAPGPWEVATTPWGSPLEMSSTDKAEWYARGYRKAVAEQRALCLGSYAFYWGNKQETTATWFGMLLPDGTRLGAVDAVVEAWTGAPPDNRCPRILSLEADRAVRLQPGSTVTASVTAADPEDDPLTFRWVLRSDTGTIGTGGDFQADEVSHDAAVSASGPSATVTLPDLPGGYRLFAYVFDGAGGAAVANVPLHVEEPTIGDRSPDRTTPESR